MTPDLPGAQKGEPAEPGRHPKERNAARTSPGTLAVSGLSGCPGMTGTGRGFTRPTHHPTQGANTMTTTTLTPEELAEVEELSALIEEHALSDEHKDNLRRNLTASVAFRNRRGRLTEQELTETTCEVSLALLSDLALAAAELAIYARSNELCEKAAVAERIVAETTLAVFAPTAD